MMDGQQEQAAATTTRNKMCFEHSKKVFLYICKRLCILQVICMDTEYSSYVALKTTPTATTTTCSSPLQFPVEALCSDSSAVMIFLQLRYGHLPPESRYHQLASAQSDSNHHKLLYNRKLHLEWAPVCLLTHLHWGSPMTQAGVKKLN